MPKNAQLSSHMQTNAQLKMQANWCRYTHSCLDMGQQHADACSALDTSRRMRKHAKLEIRAYTCRPSIRACTCMVLIHADAYSHTLWTNAE